MALFQGKLRQQNIGKDDLLADLQRVASIFDTDSVTREQYRSHGAFAPATLQKAFGSWNLALGSAGLIVAHRKGIPDEEFFSNIAAVLDDVRSTTNQQGYVGSIDRIGVSNRKL